MLRIDLIVDGRVIVELKAVEVMHPLYTAQLLTYLNPDFALADDLSESWVSVSLWLKPGPASRLFWFRFFPLGF